MKRVALAACVLACGALFAQKDKYAGPKPPKPDMLYLLHASNLIPTEAGEAKEETRKDVTANVMKGAESNVKTPMAEPIFLIESDKVSAEKLELYKMDIKNGQREVSIPNDSKKRIKNAPKQLRVKVDRIEQSLYRVEVNQWLDNGEYCMSPQGSVQVFCFQVF